MLRFGPRYKPAIWGGDRLHTLMGRALPSRDIGESWELVSLKMEQSRVIDGPLEGKSLRELWQGGSLGGSASGDFPFLVKWVDSHRDLSVQVHPDARACELLGMGDPKAEAWYITYAEPNAQLFLGHHPGLNGDTLRFAAQKGTITKWLYAPTPAVGDMLFVPAGMLHAVGAGYLLLEVQEPSTTTFRIYDWGRVGPDGQPRELHLEQAAVAVKFERHGEPIVSHQEVVGPSFAMRLVHPNEELDPQALRVLVAACGDVVLHTAREVVHLSWGETRVAEPLDGVVTLQSGKCLLLTEP